MFLHLSVILYTWGYPSMPCSRSPGGVLSQHALQVVSQHALQQVSGGGAAPGGCLVRHPPPGTATAAGGTHPTRMHSCYISDYILGNITFFVNLQVKASWRFENFSRSAYCLGRRNCWTIILEKVIKVMKGKETFYH